MKNPAVCFTGHRSIPADRIERLKHLLPVLLERLYSGGYRVFRTGGAVGFDMLAGEAVTGLKSVHPDVSLEIFLPCRGSSDRWSAEQKKRQSALLTQASAVNVLSEYYYDGCMMVRNRKMVDSCGLCVSYCRRLSGGGTYGTVCYALGKGLPLINIGEEIE